MPFVANLAEFLPVKNFGNRLRFDEIIVTIGWPFFETQCMFIANDYTALAKLNEPTMYI